MDDNENAKHPVEMIAEACGGTITSAGIAPDGSGFATISFPLRKDHWIYQGDRQESWGAYNVPPMPFRMGEKDQLSVLIQRNGGDSPFMCDKPIRGKREDIAEIMAKIYLTHPSAGVDHNV